MREEKYDISGMHCAACSASVERVTRKLPGVDAQRGESHHRYHDHCIR